MITCFGNCRKCFWQLPKTFTAIVRNLFDNCQKPKRLTSLHWKK